MPLSLKIDINNKYIEVQTVDGAGNLTGYPDVIFPYHIKSIGVYSDPKDGLCIGIDKKGGYISGVKTEYAFLIPYNQLVLYNGAGVPAFSLVFAAIYACIKSEEGDTQ